MQNNMKACECRKMRREIKCYLQMWEDNPVVILEGSGDQVDLYLELKIASENHRLIEL